MQPLERFGWVIASIASGTALITWLIGEIPLIYKIIAIIIAIVLLVLASIWHRIKKQDNPEEKELLRKIHEELRDGLESLNGTLERTTMQYEINDKKVAYKHIYMNHKVFDGSVNSGDFNHITHELQQPLQDIYGKINVHDEYVKKIIELENNSPKEEEYASILNGYEKDLLKDIPPMMDKLKKYFQ